MIGERCTACGCEWMMHHYSGLRRCTNWRGGTPEQAWADGHRCPCPGFTTAVLPTDGERLEFGKHHMNAPDAEAAEAWPSLSTIERRHVARVKRAVEREKSSPR